jgi:hypothetical protein
MTRPRAPIACFAALALSFPLPAFGADPAEKPLKLPPYRIDPREFESSEADIRAVCDSAGRELWRHFPDYTIEPFVVVRGKQGPITLYKRNDAREIVLKLDTGNTFWSQYAYQFAHEFCHVLCGYRDDDQGTQWFEETLCETASLYVLRAMAKSWKTAPPYSNWKDYRDSLREYADDVISKRKHLSEIHEKGLPAFRVAHADELRKNPNTRELNGAMAVVLLHYFEEDPSRWEAVRWINAEPSPAGDTFEKFMARWHAAAPEKQRANIAAIGKLFGVPIP